MRRILVTLSLILTSSVPLFANNVQPAYFSKIVNANAGPLDVKEVRIERIEVRSLSLNSNSFRDYQNDCSSNPGVKIGSNSNPTFHPNTFAINNDSTTEPAKEVNTTPATSDDSASASNPMSSIDPTSLSLDQIINIGKKVWEFLQANKPVVTTKTFYAQALPRGLTCWADLENWQAPRSELYRVKYLNGFGMEVVNLEFRLMYTYGGQVNGVGRYISNATVQFANLNVFWGFNVDANVEVPLVVNVGSKDDPVAGMQMSIRWQVNGLNHLERTASFFMYGDGRATQVMQ